MIKKYKKILYILLIIICLILLGFFNKSDSGYIREVGYYGYSPYDQTVDINVIAKGSFMSSLVGYTKPRLYLSNHSYWFWKYEPDLGFAVPYSYIHVGNIGNQGYVNNYAICDELLDVSLDYTLSSSDNCTVQTLVPDSKNTIVSFLQTVKQGDYFYFHQSYSPNSSFIISQFCISSQEMGHSLCFGNCRVSNSSIYSCFSFPGLSTPSGNTHGGFGYGSGFDQVDSDIMRPSPAVSTNFNGSGDVSFNTGGNQVSINPEIDDYIDYYEERFNWNYGMCYVGTNDFTGSYETGQVNFKLGSGDTIFGLYYYLYNGFGNNIIKNVGSFINVWLINYTQRFDTLDEDRLYLATYNGPDTDITLRYDDLTDPFIGQPAVIWYLAYNLFNYYSTESTQGEEMAYYCYMKLNYDNLKDGSIDFSPIKNGVSPGINKRIEDYVNNHLGGGRNGGSYIVPDISTGSIWDGLVQTGYGIPQDLSPIKLFKDYFEKINGLVSNFNAVNSNGLIPRRILYPMLFLVLFRIIRH